jgi:hypothetical protein
MNLSCLRSSLLVLSCLGAGACVSAPKFDAREIRSWSTELDKEYPQHRAVIANYQKPPYQLFYLAARHTNTFDSDTLRLVQKLFQENFDVLIVESIPYASGVSPIWLLEDAQKGKQRDFIAGGESALAVILAHEKKIPFFGGEPDHKDIYQALKARGYSDVDIIGFILVRQVPQWVREREEPANLIERKGPQFVSNYCRLFSLTNCPSLKELKVWYRGQMGRDLSADVSNEEVTRLKEGKLLTQKISSDIGFIRDHFTLNLIEQMLRTYKRVAVIYGAGHLITLRHAFDKEFGTPQFIEDNSQLAVKR